MALPTRTPVEVPKFGVGAGGEMIPTLNSIEINLPLMQDPRKSINSFNDSFMRSKGFIDRLKRKN